MPTHITMSDLYRQYQTDKERFPIGARVVFRDIYGTVWDQLFTLTGTVIEYGNPPWGFGVEIDRPDLLVEAFHFNEEEKYIAWVDGSLLYRIDELGHEDIKRLNKGQEYDHTECYLPKHPVTKKPLSFARVNQHSTQLYKKTSDNLYMKGGACFDKKDFKRAQYYFKLSEFVADIASHLLCFHRKTKNCV